MGETKETVLFVSVVARPGSPALSRCLAALAGLEVEVVEVGADGPAMARNRALERSDAEVIAYVEDDVVVPEGWAGALADAFDDELVGVAGGDLRADGPGWQVTTYGLGAGDTFHGGNVAFRAAALRGVGGFWPARGRTDQRDWFSPEHEAQRELQRAGWRSVLVPEAAATRVVGSPPLHRVLAARARTGARAVAIGGRRAEPAQLARSVAGLLSGRRAERAARAAEALGGLLGERLIRRELEPVATETPFLASVPVRRKGQSLSSHVLPVRRKGQSLSSHVLLYHRVGERGGPGLAVSEANFREQVEVLRATGRVAGLGEPGGIAITFDDGYADNAVLAEIGLPVTLFVSTGHVIDGKGFWWDAIRGLPREPVAHLSDRAFRQGDERHLARWLQGLTPEEIDAHLETLGAEADPRDRALTPDELRALASHDHVTIGAHTRTHPNLRRLGQGRQRDEIEGSRDDVERLVGVRPRAFAYPFGVPGADFDATTVQAVKIAGFTHACANAPRTDGTPLSIARHTAPDVGGEAFARWLSDLGAGRGC